MLTPEDLSDITPDQITPDRPRPAPAVTVYQRKLSKSFIENARDESILKSGLI